MMTKTRTLLLTAIIFASACLSGCAYVKALNQKLKTPAVNFQNVELREATALGIKLDFLFEVFDDLHRIIRIELGYSGGHFLGPHLFHYLFAYSFVEFG